MFSQNKNISRVLAAPFQSNSNGNGNNNKATTTINTNTNTNTNRSQLSSYRKKSFSKGNHGTDLTYTDYRSFQFKTLDPLDRLPFEKVYINIYIIISSNLFISNYKLLNLLQYAGPTPESNWVIPGILLVGAYPASQDDLETFDLITSILKLGIRKFVCLQQEVILISF